MTRRNAFSSAPNSWTSCGAGREPPAPAAPELLIAAQGDELLDWREMVVRYPQAQQRVLEGWRPCAEQLPQQLVEVLRFCDLAP